ncbi:D-alanyl-D-alanine carboxypeptidase [Paramicrobacterium humi]|uniref:D-alanyl-D-alanine carboxypeptidase n=1 Tax=Paramicrobacterium humi TaxID=640635 RepID=A0A1H4LQ07_9MICO|nr:serine hydrolase [Microbacterium humi]SEB72810.1 D-alanyl-D-alanine carboxypeptidase [Microbacterium humi]
MVEKLRHGRRGLSILALAGAGLLALTGCTGDPGPTVTLPAQADGELPAETGKQIDDAVANAMAMAAAPGAIVGVWAPWAGSSLKGYGVTEIDGKTEVEPDMAFRIGQNTQPMTCSVLLALVDKGKVSLNDKVADYLPGTVGLTGITFSNLCTGTSGLGGYRGNLDNIFIQNPERIWSPNELYNDGMATKAADPGDTFSPADTGYVLLGMALEAATGKQMNELYNEYVFTPVGMDRSTLPSPAKTELPDSSLHAYEALKVDGKLQCDAPFDESKLSSSLGYTSAGVVSTAADVHAFSQAFATGALFKKGTADVQKQTRPIGDKAESWQQYGFGTYHYGPLYGQAGDVPGFITASLSDPSSGLTIVVMLNNSTAGSGLALDLAMQLASYASKVPAAKGNTAPGLDLPWSAGQMQDAIGKLAVCQ